MTLLLPPVDVSKIVVAELDLSDLKSIKTFCTKFCQSETRLDYLVLNAGKKVVEGYKLFSATRRDSFSNHYIEYDIRGDGTTGTTGDKFRF